MTVDAELLEILVCPNDRGELDYLEDRTGHRLPHVWLPLSGARRHPGDADRRGREARREAARQAVTDLDDAAGPAARRSPGACSTPCSACRTIAARPMTRRDSADGLPSSGGRHVRRRSAAWADRPSSGDVVRSVFRRAARPPRRGEPLAGPASALRPAHARGRLVVLREHRGDARIVPFCVGARLPRAGGDLGQARSPTRLDAAGVATVRVPPGYPAPRGPRTSRVRLARRARGHGDAPGRSPTTSTRRSPRSAPCSRTWDRPVPSEDEPGEDARAPDRRSLPGHLGRGRDRLGAPPPDGRRR